MDFEDVVGRLDGTGKFQKWLLWTFLLPAVTVSPFVSMSIIFMISTPEHFCVVPRLDALELNDSQATHLGQLLTSEDQCSFRPPQMLNLTRAATLQDNHGNLSLFVNDSLHMQPCSKFAYDETDYEETASTKWDLVCDRGHLPSLVFTLGTVGSVLGTPILGVMSDRLGRRKTYFIIVAIAAATALGTVVANSFVLFAAVRFVAMMLYPQIEQIPYIILLELALPRQRTLMTGVSSMGWSLGMCLLALSAYLSRTWITLGIVITCVVIPLFCYWRFLPESPRWLLSQGRRQEAVVILHEIAIRNGLEPPSSLDADLKKVQLKISAEEESEKSTSPLVLLREPRIRMHLLILIAIWTGVCCAYTGLHINVTNLAGNEFLNFFYLAMVEIPAIATGWWTMDYFGRRWSTVFFLFLTSLSCIGPVIAPDSGPVGVASSAVAKFATSAAFVMMYQRSAELMPTPLRSFSMGIMASLSATMTAGVPYVVYLSMYGKWIPFLVLSVLLAVSGIAAAWLPETKDYPLCHSVEDAINFGKGQKFFSFNRIQEPTGAKQLDHGDGDSVEMQSKQPLNADPSV